LILDNGIADCVETPGRISAAQKQELLRKSLFVVMPSRYEGWGIVAIEAAACGKATVGTDIDGLRDSILGGQTGLLCRKEDVEDLFEKMRTLALDENCRRQLGRQGLERSRHFTWDSIAKDQDRYFQTLLGGGEA
jgi:glycosyltransferase involved in cell wall biosynthesis